MLTNGREANLAVALLAVSLAVTAGTAPVPNSSVNVVSKSFLVGGTVAQSGRYPYFVSLRSPNTTANSYSTSNSTAQKVTGPLAFQHFCGGALISDWLVLTAAHCVPDLNSAQKSDFVSAGLNFTSFQNTYRPTGATNGNVSAFIGAARLDLGNTPGNPVKLWFVHPWFIPGINQYDMAVAMLSTPARNITKAQLVGPAQDIYNAISSTQQITAIGLGDRLDQDGSDYLLAHNSSYHDIDSDPTEQLGEVNIGTLVTRLVCGRALTNDSAINSTLQNGNVIEDTPVIISDGQFCVQAAPSSPSQAEIVGSRGNYTLQAVSSYPDTCQGDSGGPVFIKGSSAASDVVLGTVAFGDGCGRNLPSVYNSIPGYTNASIFDNFLTTIMQKIPNSLASSN